MSVWFLIKRFQIKTGQSDRIDAANMYWFLKLFVDLRSKVGYKGDSSGGTGAVGAVAIS